MRVPGMMFVSGKGWYPPQIYTLPSNLVCTNAFWESATTFKKRYQKWQEYGCHHQNKRFVMVYVIGTGINMYQHPWARQSWETQNISNPTSFNSSSHLWPSANLLNFATLWPSVQSSLAAKGQPQRYWWVVIGMISFSLIICFSRGFSLKPIQWKWASSFHVEWKKWIPKYHSAAHKCIVCTFNNQSGHKALVQVGNNPFQCPSFEAAPPPRPRPWMARACIRSSRSWTDSTRWKPSQRIRQLRGLMKLCPYPVMRWLLGILWSRTITEMGYPPANRKFHRFPCGLFHCY